MYCILNDRVVKIHMSSHPTSCKGNNTLIVVVGGGPEKSRHFDFETRVNCGREVRTEEGRERLVLR